MKLVITIFFFLFLLISHSKVYADDNFNVSAEALYDVSATGVTSVEQVISIENTTDYIYAPSYTVVLGIKGVEEMTVTGENGRSIPFTVNDTKSGGKEVKVVFPDRAVGKAEEQVFILSYKTSEIAKKLGESWEVNIPGVANPNEFKNYETQVTVPENFGSASIIKPSKGVERNENTYSFSKQSIGNSGALIIFGTDEYYRLNLTFHLSNANLFPLRTEIALPPNTAYQEVIYENINPSPTRIHKDGDGNYLAEYQLNPGEEVDIETQILVKTTSQPTKQEVLSEKKLKEFTRSKEYWDANNNEIRKLAQELKTPENIYQYLVNNFKYNYEKANTNNRLGARQALKDRENVVCLEFTDLFVALARSAGIPARSVEGYAYTSNHETKPRSLSSDILHAWPEYYDTDKKMWVMVDPTWGNTTHGLDYFNELDLSHITFVRKGSDPDYPIPAGGYAKGSEKQVKVSFADPKEFKQVEKTAITAKASPLSFPYLIPSAAILVSNAGNTPLSDKTLVIKRASGEETTHQIEDIPPGGSTQINLSLTGGPLTSHKETLTMQLDQTKITQDITVGWKREDLFMLGGGVAIGILILACSYKAGSLLIQGRRK